MLGLIKPVKKKKFNFLTTYLVPFFIIFDFFLFFSLSFFIFLIRKNQLTAINKNILIKTLPIAPKVDTEISAEAAIIFDRDSGTVIYKKNDNLRFSPASSAKIMTALIALDSYPINAIIEARNIGVITGSKMDLQEGEKMKINDLLYGLMLPSGNDAAFTLAENVEGGVKTFISRMNKKAKDLKLDNTFFVDPDGYDDNNFTTAFDLVRLSSYAVDNEIFAKIVSTEEKTVYDISGLLSHRLINLNELLEDKNIKGIKTGFTNEAGGVLVTSYFYKGKNFIIAVLKSQDRFGDTKILISQIIKKSAFISF